MSCEFCRKADFGNFKAVADKYSAAIFLAGGSSRYPKNEQFNFCPMCGEPLTEPVPLTLEQLKSHNGAVWLLCEHWQGWAFPFYAELDNCLFFNCHGHDTIRRNEEDYNSDTKWSFICHTHKPNEVHP